MEEILTSMRWWDGKENARDACKLNSELWANTPFPNYAVSNMGRVASAAHGSYRVMSGSRSGAGYISYVNGKMGHQLVVLAFDGPAPTTEHTDIRHLDRSRDNNRLDNLAWGTRSENMMDVKTVRFTEKQQEALRLQNQSEAEGTWYGGRTWDKPLVETLSAMHVEHKLRLEDVARILDVSVHALPACFRAHEVEVPMHGRRSIHETELIRQSIKEGLTLKDINQLPEFQARKLTHQDFYYFKTSVGIQSEYVPPPVLQGEDHGCAKLTEAHVYDVFRRIESGEFQDMKQVQEALGVTKSIAYGVVSGRSWKHLHRSEALKHVVASFTRQVLSLEDQKAVLEALVRGDPREQIKKQYALSDSKLQTYITKANKKKKELAIT